MSRLPEEYRISSERVPRPGKRITEAIGLHELLEAMDKQAVGFPTETDKEDDKVAKWTTIGMVATVIAVAGYRGYRHRKGE